MSLVIATPQLLATAALDLASIGSQVSAANAAAAMPTTEVV
ncbi:PE domain-containing protein, partial [Mycobacterium tuberculosis]